MKFSSTLLTLTLGALSQCIQAAPMAKTSRDVWDPKMLYPLSEAVWYSGQTYTVRWDTSDQPPEITHPITQITLAFDGIESPVVLANGFDIRDGQVEVTAPLVNTGGRFSLVLWGDSGNIGPEFTIVGVNP